MSRVPVHSIETTPDASRLRLEEMLAGSALVSGTFAADEKLGALLAVAHEAAVHAGHVDDTTCSDALDAGWIDTQLAETLVCIAPTAFVDSFVRYARTELDVPAQPIPAGMGLQ